MPINKIMSGENTSGRGKKVKWRGTENSSKIHRCNFSSHLTLLLQTRLGQPQAICCFTGRQLIKMTDNCWCGSLTNHGGGGRGWQSTFCLPASRCTLGFQVVSCNISGREQFVFEIQSTIHCDSWIWNLSSTKQSGGNKVYHRSVLRHVSSKLCF